MPILRLKDCFPLLCSVRGWQKNRAGKQRGTNIHVLRSDPSISAGSVQFDTKIYKIFNNLIKSWQSDI